MFKWTFWILAIGMIAAVSAEACTGIKLKAKDGALITGRTVEFGVPIEPSVVVIPRGYKFMGTTPRGDGLAYTSKYGVTGLICYDELAVMDGINEKGLCVCVFYFPGYAQYAQISASNQSRALSPTEFPNWILTQFATLEEVHSALASVVIAPTVIKKWGPTPPPFHYIVYDPEGNSLVIEPLDGQLMTYSNPIGTFTNSPTFDWHMTHLRSFINLHVENPNPVTIEGITFAPFGYGAGMLGLPGDFTPPSRFVQAAIFSTTALTPKDAQDGVGEAFHILNQFDITKGVSGAKENGTIHFDFTILTSVKDLQSLHYYLKTYDDQTIKFIDLKQFNLDEKSVRKAPLDSPQTFVDFSSQLK